MNDLLGAGYLMTSEFTDLAGSAIENLMYPGITLPELYGDFESDTWSFHAR